MARKATPKKRQTSTSQSSLRDYKPVKKATVRKGKVRAKPKQYPQRKVPGTDKQIDRSIRAKPVGWRISDKTGRRYFEDRENRSDTDKERRYHGGVNRRAEPAKRTAKVSTRTTRSTTTSRRVSQVGKRDTQKGHRAIKASIKEIIEGVRKKKGTVKGRVYSLITPESERNTKKLTAEELLEVAKEYGRKIQDAPYENQLFLDEYGNCYAHYKGNEKRVTFPESALYSAAVSIHNHPDGGVRDYYTPQSGADIANLFRASVPIHNMVVTHGRWYNWSASNRGGVPFKSGRISTCDGLRREVDRILEEIQDAFILKMAKGNYIGCKFMKINGKKTVCWSKLYHDMPDVMQKRLENRTFKLYIQNRWQVMVPVEEGKIRTLINNLGERKFKFMKGEL
ncbi:hypothetical protein J6A32_08145 [Methanocorpusculum sp.]|nr:hypothetical protein [Methanocorpusculum sp.]